MSPAEPRYVPAAGHRAFTRLYDPLLALTMRERTFRGRLLGRVRAGLPPHGRVADVGCGTGTFAIAVAAATGARVTGVDGDPSILSIARAKAGAADVDWIEGRAESLPLPDAGTDVVVMSLVLHHLVPSAKSAALAEAARVLRPGGRLHVADWGKPQGPLSAAVFSVVRLADGREQTRDHAEGRLPATIAAAGFDEDAPRQRLGTAFGTLELISAVRR
ncbi:MAG: class I SAM-dependent methyltransferase [Thermoleophilaceae bacterium]|nr:class I SAM-dependent methyltransferase [Thermoleophilaceae bacterium]